MIWNKTNDDQDQLQGHEEKQPVRAGEDAMNVSINIACVLWSNAFFSAPSTPEPVPFFVKTVFELLQLVPVVLKKKFVLRLEPIVNVEVPFRELFESLHFMKVWVEIWALDLGRAAIERLSFH